MIFALPAMGSMRLAGDSWKTVPPAKSFDEGTRVEYSLTLLANPEEGGEVIGSGMYEVGEVIYIQAIENDGYDFYDWTMDGEHYLTSGVPVVI